LADQAGRHDVADENVHGGDDEHGGGGGRVPADRHGEHQVGAPGFLLGAGQPGSHQHGHQPDDDETGAADLERHLPAEGVEALDGTFEDDGRSVVRNGGGCLVQVGLRGVQPLDARRGRHDQKGDPDDPHGDAHAVAPHDEAGERESPGEFGHRGRSDRPD
jgi:hypothetical protein